MLAPGRKAGLGIAPQDLETQAHVRLAAAAQDVALFDEGGNVGRETGPALCLRRQHHVG